jgi:hypothetical protein
VVDSDKTLWMHVVSGVTFPVVLFGCSLAICLDPDLVRDMLLSDWPYLTEERRSAAMTMAEATERGLREPGVAGLVSANNAWLGVRSKFFLDATTLVVGMLIAERRASVRASLHVMSRSTWILVCGEIVGTVSRIGTRRLYSAPAASFWLRPFDAGDPLHNVALSVNLFVVGYVCIMTHGLAKVQSNPWSQLFLIGCLNYIVLVLVSLTGIGKFMVLP